MNATELAAAIAALPKAELHLHLEGSIVAETVVRLAARHGVSVSPTEVAARYRFDTFAGFLDAYKWVTSFLREPQDYALIADELFARLIAQNVVYAEITLSVGVMLRRGQDIAANFAALRQAAARADVRDLRVQWIFDAARQFGSEAALETARWAVRLAPEGVVAFGIGGDELALSARDLQPAYDLARSAGLHAVAHAGEIGGPEIVREAIDLLGAERIGHGIGVMHDPALMERLAGSAIPLEICPTSNLRTGALARQLGAASFSQTPLAPSPDSRSQRIPNSQSPELPRDAGRGTLQGPPMLAVHPLKNLFDRGLRVVLSTDDPAIFETDLLSEYRLAAELGFSPQELVRLCAASFEAALLLESERRAYCETFRRQAAAHGLL